MTSSPVPSVPPVPSGQTARRVEWHLLPPHIRELVAERCGSPVVDATTMGSGFTPGFASVLTCEDGSKHFVKAAATRAQRTFADSYREEARKLRALDGLLPAPRLLWTHDEDWMVLGLAHVDARLPVRPWQQSDLDLLLDRLEEVAAVTVPHGARLDPMTDDLADVPACWDTVHENHPDLPHADEAAALAARFVEALDGSALQHTDIRDDNTLLDAEGRVWICDWNWPVVGAAWFDTVSALIGPRGDGLDVEQVLARRALTRDVPSEHVDILLALLAGYFLKSADDPVPPTSPYLRQGQAWQGQVVWDWLAERRGWDRPPPSGG